MNSTLYLDRCSSTNDVAKDLAEKGAEHGQGVIARCQEKGRGRNNKIWVSDYENGLWCSLILRPGIPAPDYPKLTIVAGVAVAEAIEALTRNAPDLKWPNDIYFAGRKCGGILVESCHLQSLEKAYAIVGIGINLDTAAASLPHELQASAIGLLEATGTWVPPMKLYELIRLRLLDRTRQLAQGDFAEIRDLWQARDFLRGEQIRWQTASGERILGRGMGMNARGEYLVQDDQGILHQVISGELQAGR